MNRSRLPFVLPLLVAGCMPAPRIAPPRPAPAPPLLAPPPPAEVDWKDAPPSAGGWSYVRDAAGSAARFGLPGALPAFELRCDLATRVVSLFLPAAAAGTMTITTSYGARSWQVAVRDGRAAVSLSARDPFLDQLAFSRARFALQGAGVARLILPNWAEPSRVVEDCRA